MVRRCRFALVALALGCGPSAGEEPQSGDGDGDDTGSLATTAGEDDDGAEEAAATTSVDDTGNPVDDPCSSPIPARAPTTVAAVPRGR